MTDAEDLARRYLDLWRDYITALTADLTEPELLERWTAACSALAGNREPRDAGAIAPARRPRPPADASSTADTARQRGDIVADLARRLAQVEDRLSVLERREPETPRPRIRNRRPRV